VSETVPVGTNLVLASTSPWRRELLARLVPRFRVADPAVDESPREGEAPAARALRLAQAKALAVAADAGPALVIGSDQVASLGTLLLRKPASAEAAGAQLTACAGQAVVFHTAVCVADTRRPDLPPRTALDTTRVLFRPLAPDEIARYVASGEPLVCAGSFKAEGLGIALFERIESDDPTALVGMPLIALARLLREAGLAVP
jgi:septum formation protein